MSEEKTFSAETKELGDKIVALTLLQAKELAKLAEKARENTFSIEDLRGTTFSISNLGAIGGTYSTPIINIPEVAILLVGRSRKMPVVRDDQVVVRLMMPLIKRMVINSKPMKPGIKLPSKGEAFFWPDKEIKYWHFKYGIVDFILYSLYIL